MKKFLGFMRDPLIEDINIDGEDRLTAHRRMLSHKQVLRDVFLDFHLLFRKLDEKYFLAEGKRIEIGAGIAPIRDTFPDVLATDIVRGDHLDRVLDAENMDLPDNSVRVIYGQNCFHHFPHPDQFFSELDRVLAPGGGAILLEPYYGPFASFLYKRLFKTEGFDKEFPSWETPVTGPMNGANQALSYIIFQRDRAIFERKHPALKIVHQQVCHNHLKYLVSGGLNFRQLLPNWVVPAVGILQFILRPLDRWLALHHVVVIRKKIR